MRFIFSIKDRVRVYLRLGKLAELLAGPLTVIKASTVLKGHGCANVVESYFHVIVAELLLMHSLASC